MAFLLDTCLLSEFFKKQPDSRVSDWFAEQLPDTLFLSVLTIGELRKGLLRLPQSRKKTEIAKWINDVKVFYGRRILNFGLTTTEIWARIRAQSESVGKPLSMIDSLIAASAVEHQLTVATRNVRDFERCGVETFNPWSSNE